MGLGLGLGSGPGPGADAVPDGGSGTGPTKGAPERARRRVTTGGRAEMGEEATSCSMPCQSMPCQTANKNTIWIQLLGPRVGAAPLFPSLVDGPEGGREVSLLGPVCHVFVPIDDRGRNLPPRDRSGEELLLVHKLGLVRLKRRRLQITGLRDASR